MTESKSQIRYEIRITEESSGWSVSAIMYRTGAASTFALGGLEKIITYPTKDQAFEAAKEAIDTIKSAEAQARHE